MFQHKTFNLPVILGMLSGLLLTGCAHELEVKNMLSYHNNMIMPLNQRISIGIQSTAPDIHSEKLVKAVGLELQKNADVYMPYVAGPRPVDAIVSMSLLPRYKGSGWNFLINWPGFLIWTPAWNGYVYRVYFDVAISIVDAKANKQIDSFNVPLYFNVRHADINRTWTEISWLEVSAIAFIGGLVFISYDDNVTPELVHYVGPTIGDYIAQEIVSRMNSYGGFQPQTPAPGGSRP
jgi:hypothetical protein